MLAVTHRRLHHSSGSLLRRRRGKRQDEPTADFTFFNRLGLQSVCFPLLDDALIVMAQSPKRSSSIAGSGFLGATSFSSVYNENQSLHTLHPDLLGHGDAIHGGREQFFLLNRDSKIRTGAACLTLLRDWPTYDILVRKWQSGAELSMIAPWIIACQSSMKTEVYDRLGTSDDEIEHQLLHCSARIFDNTLRPLNLQRGWTLDQYGDQFTAGNIRWEAVGIFYAAVGLAAMVVEDVSAAPDSAEKRYFLAKQMLEASDMCISFCEEFQQLTDPEMWLICENLHMCTLVTGDASYLTWRRLGDMISACVARGLHGEIQVSADVPFWMSELRKRLFAATYIFDKSISNFLGRPPRLPRKYCTMQLPLDLEPKHLRMPEAELEDVVNRLDQQGWNTNASLSGMVWVRCHFIMSMICEDVLELALAALPEDDGSLCQYGCTMNFDAGVHCADRDKTYHAPIARCLELAARLHQRCNGIPTKDCT